MRHRVIQWGTGNVGYHSLRHLIRHPDFEVVGLHAHSEHKLGKDAAELAGLEEKTGVLATNEIDALLALKPDCVVYTANGELRPSDAVADMARILRAGIDVVSTAMIYLIYPPHAQPEHREPLEEACREGGSTLFVNGVDPGFSGDVLPLAALQVCGEVEEIRVQEIFDYSTYQDPDFTGVALGFGRDASTTPIMAMPGMLILTWGGMIDLVARALGVEVEEKREVFERDFAKEGFDCPMMRIEKGQCSAVRFEVQGLVGGRPLIVAEHVTRLGLDQAPHWPQAPQGRRGVHRCVVTGNPGIELECSMRGEDGDHTTGGVQATALRVINAIPVIRNHAPGIVSTLDLPFTPTSHIRGR
jgi:hypothetical protein